MRVVFCGEPFGSSWSLREGQTAVTAGGLSCLCTAKEGGSTISERIEMTIAPQLDFIDK